ncbi:MAG: hypothetical protein WD469_12215 [Paenibacillaceae bacterium]
MTQPNNILDLHNWAPANLQNGDIFINKKLVSGVVLLSVAKNEIYETEQGSGEWLMTFEGYKACNKVAGIQVISPESLLLPDGRVVSNPYVDIDATTNTSHKFMARCVAIGKNSLGKPYISSATIIFDAKLAFVEELSKSMEKNKDLGRYYMDGMLSDKEKSTGMYRLFDGDMGIWVDRSLPEVTAIIQKFISNKNNGDKRVVTMAQKAALQRQPCMPPVRVNAINGFASVLVGTHIADFSESEIAAMLQEYSETGKVSGADVVESSEDISKVDDQEGFSLLSEGGIRF